MHLVQILLPLYDNQKRPLDRGLFERVRGELTERFGGVTAHLRSPAVGAWKESDGEVARDDVVTYEVAGGALPPGGGAGARPPGGAALTRHPGRGRWGEAPQESVCLSERSERVRTSGGAFPRRPYPPDVL
jgi:hypothetical protein